MPVNIHITGESARDALVELRVLAGGLSGSAAPAAEPKDAPKADKPSRSSSTKKLEPVKEETPVEPKSEPAVEESEESGETESGDIPSVVDLRAKAQEVGTTPEAKKAIKALLDEFGSKSISDVPEEQRAAFMSGLAGLA